MPVLKVLFVPLDTYGHINSCIGIAEKIIQFGHQVTFALEKAWLGKLSKYGFNEIIYVDQSRGPNQGPNDYWVKSIDMIAETLPEDSLYKAQHQSVKEFEDFVFNVLNFNDELKSIINQINPDVIVLDHYFTVPAIYQSGRKWIYMTSATPLSAIIHPDTPPTGSGYPIDGDRKEWQIFNEVSEKHDGPIINKFNQVLMEKYGLPSLPEGSAFHPSPYLNIYAYPEELDYLDIRPLPDKWKRYDNFIRSSQVLTNQKFELSDKLKNRSGKLIFVSMGSMGCSQLNLTKRLVEILSQSPHRILMVMGSCLENVKLPDNIWGDKMLPQVQILPMVDLVITHGGNNTVIESLYYGKPMILCPLFYDQYDNAQRVTEKGYGYRTNPYKCEPRELLEMIESILNDQNMNDRCRKISKRMQNIDSPMQAAKDIIDIALEK